VAGYSKMCTGNYSSDSIKETKNFVTSWATISF